MIFNHKYFRLLLGSAGMIAFAILAVPIQAQTAPAQGTSISATRAVNSLGVHVLQRLSGQRRNVLISPLNLGGSLAQLVEGARGATRIDLMRLMGWPAHASPSEVGRAMRHLLAVRPSESGSTMKMANALLVNQDVLLRSSFLQRERRYFGASAKSVDFSDPNSVSIVNAWIASRTQGRIKHIVDGFRPADGLVLIGGLYFEGLWENPFDPSKTKPGRFSGVDGRVVMVPFMHRFADMDYLEGADYQAVSLVLFEGYYSVVFVVPRKGISRLPDKVMKHGSAVYDAERYEWRKVRLSLPRLKLSYRRNLLGTLKTMTGLPFSERADYGAISTNRLAVDKMSYKATLDVDEKGASAAAGTVSGITELGMNPGPRTPVTVRVDRPFYFIIKNRFTGTIVMMGHVVDPGTRAEASSRKD